MTASIYRPRRASCLFACVLFSGSLSSSEDTPYRLHIFLCVRLSDDNISRSTGLIPKLVQPILADVTNTDFAYLGPAAFCIRSEEHTSELQSRPHLVCRLLLEKKKKTIEISLFPLLCCLTL